MSSRCQAVSPAVSFRPVLAEHGDGDHDEQVVLDDEVRDEDTDLTSIIVGKEWISKSFDGVQPLPSPKPLTDAELARHLLAHLPYRNGCRYCVMGRRPNMHHKRRRRLRAIPMVSADWISQDV